MSREIECDQCGKEVGDHSPWQWWGGADNQEFRICFDCAHPQPLRAIPAVGEWFGFWPNSDTDDTMFAARVIGWAERPGGASWAMVVESGDDNAECARQWEGTIGDVADPVTVRHSDNKPTPEEWRVLVEKLRKREAREERDRKEYAAKKAATP